MERPERDDSELEGLIEALLFVTDGPASIEHLATTLEVPPERVQKLLADWPARHANRGLIITRSREGVLLTTRPDAAWAIERFLGLTGGGHLSSAAMETLAIIAYLQPVTRARIDSIRGVSSASVTRNLIAREMVEVVGNLEQAGRPELLGTTVGFLQYLGLSSLEELPKITKLEEILQAADEEESAPSSGPAGS